MKKLILICCLLMTAITTNAQQKDFPKLTGPYLGQKPPGMSAEPFAPHTISTGEYEHGAPAFSPDGKELFWSVFYEKEFRQRIFFTRLGKEGWSESRPAPFSDERYLDGNPLFSIDGKRVYFTSNRPLSVGGVSRDKLLWIWFVEKRNGGWSAPSPLKAEFDQVGLSGAPSFDGRGTLYFSSWQSGGLTPGHIYAAKLREGAYRRPQHLGTEINEAKYQAYPYVSPDGGFMLFESRRPGGLGSDDLYISFRKKGGGWTRAVNLGSAVNSPASDRCPTVTPDGRYIFFISNRSGNYDYYWIDAGIIEILRAKEREFAATVPTGDLLPAKWPVIKGAYLGEKTPGLMPVLFSPGVLSSVYWDHGAPSFLADGSEVYWSVVFGEDSGILLCMKMVDGEWRSPQRLPFSEAGFRDTSPALSGDGGKLYFTSCRPVERGGKTSEFNMWVAERMGDGWFGPRLLAPEIASGRDGRPCFPREDVLYFGSWREGTVKGSNIFRSERTAGRFGEPVRLDAAFNSDNSMPAWVSADEDCLIFESFRPGVLGGSDFWISFRQKNGDWGEAVNLGEPINSRSNDWFGGFSPDGKFFFFVSDRGGNNDYYWVDAGIIEDVKPKELK